MGNTLEIPFGTASGTLNAASLNLFGSDSQPNNELIVVTPDNTEITKAVLLTVTADPQVSSVEYSYGNGQWKTYDDPIVVLFNTPLYFRGIIGGGYTDVVEYDVSNIAVANAPEVTPDETEWTNNPVNLTVGAVTPLDPEIPLNPMTYQYQTVTVNGSVDPDAWVIFDFGSEVTITENADVYVRAVETANLKYSSYLTLYSVSNIDTIAPVIDSVTWDWNYGPTAQVTVTVTTSDNLSGVTSTEYSINGEDWIEFDQTFVMDNSGSFQLKVTDAAGNVTIAADEVPGSVFTVDWTPQSWTNEPVTVSVSAAPPASEISVVSLEYSINGGDWAIIPGSTEEAGVISADFAMTENGSFRLRAKDSLGNMTVSDEYEVTNIDTVPVTIESVTWDAAWTRKPVTITVETSDSLSPAFTEYTFNGGDWTVFADTFEIAENGTFQIRASDAAGNVTLSNAYEVTNIDLAGPVIESVDWTPQDWTAQPIQIVVTASDSQSGLGKMQYSLNGVDWVEFEGGSFELSGNGFVQIQVSDKVNNVSLTEITISNFDAMPPEIYDVEWDKAWTSQPVTVSASARDYQSGIDKLEYSVNGGAWNTYEAPFVMESNGTFQFRATDKAGNETVSEEYAVTNIDTVAPVINSVSWPTDWTKADSVTVTVDVSDDLSGVAATYYQFNDSAWIEFAGSSFTLTDNGSFAVKVVDNVGHETISSTYNLTTIDRQAPVIDSVSWPTEWTKAEKIEITVAASDDLSGVAATYYQFNGGAWTAFSGSFELTTNGSFAVKAVDNAGNQTVSDDYIVNTIDRLAPAISSVTWTSAWTSAPVTVQVTAADLPDAENAASGIASLEYSINGEDWTEFASTFVMAENGLFLIRAIDNAGNETLSGIYEVDNIDTVAPVIDSVSWSSKWTNADSVTVTVVASDDMSGVAATYYQFDGGAWTAFSGSFDLTANGSFAVKAVDQAGNETVSSAYNIKTIDRLAPVISEVSWDSALTNNDVAVSVSAVDFKDANNRSSGIAKLEFSFNGGDWSEFIYTFGIEENGSFQIRATDNAGNIALSDIFEIDNIDKTAPVLSAAWDTAWTPQPVNVAATASDVSGVGSFEYSINGGDWIALPTEVNDEVFGNFLMESNGTFRLRAADILGNVRVSDEYAVTNVDPVAPVINSISWSSAWSNADSVAVTVAASDNLSGVAAAYYMFDNSDWMLLEGSSFDLTDNGSFAVKVVDNAGNEKVSEVLSLDTIDRLAPVISDVLWDGSWTDSAVSVQVNAVDLPNTVYPASGIAKLEFSINGINWTEFTSSFEMVQNGTFQVRATDAAGNVTVSDEYEVTNISTVGPVISTISWDPTLTNVPVTVNVSAVASESGSTVLEYSLDGETWMSMEQIDVGDTSTGSFAMTENGTFRVRATDAAGNATVSNVYEVTNIDLAGPVISSVTWDSAWTNAATITVTVTTYDTLSSVAATYYSFNGAPWTVFENSFTVTANGPFAIKAVDTLSNETVSTVYNIQSFDRLAPVISDVSWNTEWTTGPVTIQLSASDPFDAENKASGIVGTEYTLDGINWTEFTQNSFSMSANGTFRIRVTDAAGNVTVSDEYAVTNISQVGPVISDVSWNTALTKSPVAVNVTAIASESGSTVLEYKAGGAWIVIEDTVEVAGVVTGSFSLSQNTDFQVRAIDGAGNVTVSGEYAVTNIDITAPTIDSISWSGDWTNAASIAVTVEASDYWSGVKATYFTFNGTPWTAFTGSFDLTANGPFAVKVVDNAGNETVSPAYNIKTIDRLAPVIDSVAWDDTTLTNEPVTVSVTVSDPADDANKSSGVAATYYSLDGASWTAFNDSFDITANGPFAVKVVDNAGNETISPTYNITTIDTLPPVISQVDWNTTWTNSSVTVTVSAYDAETSLTALEYSLDGADWAAVPNQSVTAGVVTGSFTLDENAEFKIRATDAAGNVTVSNLYSVTNIDITAPVIGSIDWSSAWTSGESIAVTVQASDYWSGVAATYYTFNGTPWTLFDGSFSLTENGPFAVKVVDNVGNETISPAYNIKTFDRLAPVIDSVIWDNTTWTNAESITVTVTASDPADAANKSSGVAATYYSFNGSSWTAFSGSFDLTANGPFSVKVVDNAGNETISDSYMIDTIDRLAPVISDISWNTGWTHGAVDVQVTAADPADAANPASGVAKLEYSFDGEEWTEFTSSFSLTENGIFQVRVTDAAGNATLSDVLAVDNIDTVAPEFSSIVWSGEWTNAPSVAVQVECSDDYSGVAATYYTFNGTPWIAFDGVFNLTENGPFAVKVVDNAGNETISPASNIKTIDRLAPVISDISWNTEWTTDPVTIQVTAADLADAANKASGIVALEYSIGGGAWIEFTDTFVMSQNGTFQIRVTDAAGNVTLSDVLEVDNIDPAGTSFSVDWNHAWTNASVTVSVAATAYSGLTSLEYTTNGVDWIAVENAVEIAGVTIGSFDLSENTTFQLRASDGTGSMSFSNEYALTNIDTVAPVVDSITWSGEWTNAASVTVSVAVSDDLSGVAAVYYTFNGTPWAAFDGSFDLTANGPFAVKVVDNAGNETMSPAYNIKTIDRLAPVISDISWDDSGWTSDPVTIQVTAADLADAENKASGIAVREYSFNGGAWTAFTGDSFTLTENGLFQVRMTDAAGNVTLSDVLEVDNIDSIAPTLIVADWSSAWTADPITIGLNAADSLSGVSSFEYSINGESWISVPLQIDTPAEKLGSIVMEQNGTFQVRAVDFAGNLAVSDVYEVISIDTVAPVIDSVTWPGDWTNAASIAVTVESSDNMSGVAATYYQLDGGAWTAFTGSFDLTANGQFAVKVVDNAGNETVSSTYDIDTIDRLAPVISDISWNTAWTTEPVAIQVTADDLADAEYPASGIASLEYSFNGEAWTEFTSSFSLVENGSFQVRATDAAGNTTLSAVLDLTNIDLSGPTLLFSKNESWTMDPVTVNVGSFDSQSGLASLEYSVNGSEWADIPDQIEIDGYRSADFVMDENGTFQLRATDILGNQTVTDVVEVGNIDRIAPTIDSVVWSPEWTNTDVEVTLEASDNLSGVGMTFFTLNGYWWTEFDGSFELSANGSFTLKVIDNAGNETISGTYIVDTIDRLAPVITDISWNTAWTTEPVTIHAAAVDLADAQNPASGLASLEYSFDGGDWTEFTDTFVIEENGSFQIRATDAAGNETLSDIQFVTNIDQDGTTFVVSWNEAWTNVPVTIDVMAAAYSGVTSLEYTVNGTDWMPVANAEEISGITVGSFDLSDNTTFQLRATDGASVLSFSDEYELTNIDLVAPVIDSVSWSGEWTNAASVTVTVAASDNLSGVAATYYQFDGSAWTAFEGSFDLTDNGLFAVKAVDNAGNETVSSTCSIETIDRLAPVISDISWNTGWTATEVAIQVTADDLADASNKASGLASVEYSIDGGDWTAFTDSFVMEENGSFQVRATDNAGNTVVSDVLNVTNIDHLAPAIDSVDWDHSWTTQPVEIDVAASDSQSGLAVTQYSLNGVQWVDFENSFTVTTAGLLQIRAIDNVGNVTILDTEIKNIDQVAPEINDVVWDTAPTYGPVTIQVVALDFQSGMASTEYSIDGGDWTLFENTFTMNNNGTFQIRAADIAGNQTVSDDYIVDNIIGQASSPALVGEEIGDAAALLQQGTADAAFVQLEPVSASAASGLAGFDGFDDGFDAVSAGSSLLAAADAADYTGVSSDVEKFGKTNAASFGLLAS